MSVEGGQCQSVWRVGAALVRTQVGASREVRKVLPSRDIAIAVNWLLLFSPTPIAKRRFEGTTGNDAHAGDAATRKPRKGHAPILIDYVHRTARLQCGGVGADRRPHHR